MKQLKDIMTSDVQVVMPHASLREAAQQMKRLNVGALPVCDGDRLAGMITDRDIAVRAVSEGMSPDQTRVRDVMTQDMAFCFEDDDVRRAARLMQDRKVRRLVVLDRNRELSGIVSLGDLAVEATRDDIRAKTLEKVSEPIFFRNRRSGMGFMRSILIMALGISSSVGIFQFIRRRNPSLLDETRRDVTAA